MCENVCQGVGQAVASDLVDGCVCRLRGVAWMGGGSRWKLVEDAARVT